MRAGSAVAWYSFPPTASKRRRSMLDGGTRRWHRLTIIPSVMRASLTPSASALRREVRRFQGGGLSDPRQARKRGRQRDDDHRTEFGCVAGLPQLQLRASEGD